MRILMLHNYYQQYGGEDASTNLEVELLQKHGEEVYFFTKDNQEISQKKAWQKSLLPFQTIWSKAVYKEVKHIIKIFKPDIAHFQNFFPLISPSAYYACQEENIPVIQTLRNYRLFCLNGTFFRNGTICKECVAKRNSLPGVAHQCYRNSITQSATVAIMIEFHRWRQTWDRQVDLYIALTNYSKDEFIRNGLSSEKIVVKPNYIKHQTDFKEQERSYALFVGRLTKEKGIEFLVNAWGQDVAAPLKIVGDGPSTAVIKPKLPQQIELVGELKPDQVALYMQKALFLVVPSLWYETFGRVIVEAFACGTPVIASRLGAMAEVVEDGKTGLLFTAGNAEDLRQKIIWAIGHPAEMAQMGKNARVEYKANYTAEKNYQLLLDIYQQVHR